jgi:hypothetical protein
MLARSFMGDCWYIYITSFNGAGLTQAFNVDITCVRQIVARRLTTHHTLPPDDVMQSPRHREAVIPYHRSLRRDIMQDPFPAKSNGLTLLLRTQHQNHCDVICWASMSTHLNAWSMGLDLRIVATEY